MTTIGAARPTSTGLEEHLAVLTGRGQGRGWLELRYRTRTGMRSLYYPAAHGRGRRSLTQVVANVSRHADVYLACALRDIKAGHKTAIGQAWTLWAECDGPHAARALDAFTPSPSLLVASGTPGHVHAYWALEQPVSIEDLEDANRRLAHALGADPVCYDAARILRPPGTLNHKHQPPTPVTQLTTLRRRPHRLADVIAALPAAPRPAPSASAVRVESVDPLLAVSPRDYVPALTGQPLGRDFKTACPLHHDDTPSLHAYPTAERGWFCFGCRQGGSIYDLAASLWQLDTRGRDFLELQARLVDQLL